MCKLASQRSTDCPLFPHYSPHPFQAHQLCRKGNLFISLNALTESVYRTLLGIQPASEMRGEFPQWVSGSK
jgi:hypothetical protein